MTWQSGYSIVDVFTGNSRTYVRAAPASESELYKTGAMHNGRVVCRCGETTCLLPRN
jgi:hypothetical protein